LYASQDDILRLELRDEDDVARSMTTQFESSIFSSSHNNLAFNYKQAPIFHDRHLHVYERNCSLFEENLMNIVKSVKLKPDTVQQQ